MKRRLALLVLSGTLPCLALEEPQLVVGWKPGGAALNQLQDVILFALDLRETFEEFRQTRVTGDLESVSLSVVPLPNGKTGVAGVARRGSELIRFGEEATLGGVQPADADAWGSLTPAWLGFPAESRDGRILSQSLARIRSVTWRASGGEDAVQLAMRTEASSESDARILADALREFLAPFQSSSNSVEAVREALLKAEVRRDGGTVELVLPLTVAALERLHGNDGSRRLLRWRLGSEEREARQKIEEIWKALDLSVGEVVADVGAGEGFFTVRLAEAVGESGRVYAVDIVPQTVASLRDRIGAGPFPQAEAVLGSPDNPGLPAGRLDAALIVNAYHEMTLHQAMLEHLKEALKPGGRLVLVEPVSAELRGAPRAEQEKKHVIAPEIVEKDLEGAGFEVVYRKEGLTEREWLILARRSGQ